MKRFLTTFLLTLLCIPLFGQVSYDFTVFNDEASYAAPLYRGREATRYSFYHEGHCYWEEEDFREGTLDFNGKTYYNVLLNIDAAEGDLLVLQKGSVVPIILNFDLVESFSIGGREFRKVTGQVKAVDGYYELLKGDAVVLRRVEKTLSNARRTVKVSGKADMEKYVPVFRADETFYLVGEDGMLSRIGRRAARKYSQGL